MTAVCGNPDCGEVYDQPGTPHRDRDTGKEVTLCPTCTTQVAASNHHRYERTYPPPEEHAHVSR